MLGDANCDRSSYYMDTTGADRYILSISVSLMASRPLKYKNEITDDDCKYVLILSIQQVDQLTLGSLRLANSPA